MRNENASMRGVDVFFHLSIVTRAKHQPGLGAHAGPAIDTEKTRMHVHRHASRTLGVLAAGCLLVAGCGPTVFSDDSAFGIAGTPPAAPEPEAEEAPAPQKRVELRDNKIVINEKVQFKVASAEIKAVSHDLLNEVADVIKKNPQIKKIEVQGHASAEGADKYNLRLSDRRAKAVRGYLVKKGGIAKDVLSAKGYGETQPIADNDSEDGRVKNRRVEFVVTEQDVTTTKVEIDDQGNEKVVEESK